MFSRNYKKRATYRNKYTFIEGVCLYHDCHSEEFCEQLTRLIASSVESEYVHAVYDAMTSPDNLDRTAIDFCVSVPTLSRKIRKCQVNWDRYLHGWKLISAEDYKKLQQLKKHPR